MWMIGETGEVIDIIKKHGDTKALEDCDLRKHLVEELADFIYVFDTPSSDIAAMRKMAAYSDGIVVWGGDAAVAAVRQMAPVGAKLIEWGHRLSLIHI